VFWLRTKLAAVLQLRQFVELIAQVAQEGEQREQTGDVGTSNRPGRQAQLPLIPDRVSSPEVFLLFKHEVQAVGDEHMTQPLGQGRQTEPFL
jgi:hypothetical protein